MPAYGDVCFGKPPTAKTAMSSSRPSCPTCRIFPSVLESFCGGAARRRSRAWGDRVVTHRETVRDNAKRAASAETTASASAAAVSATAPESSATIPFCGGCFLEGVSLGDAGPALREPPILHAAWRAGLRAVFGSSARATWVHARAGLVSARGGSGRLGSVATASAMAARARFATPGRRRRWRRRRRRGRARTPRDRRGRRRGGRGPARRGWGRRRGARPRGWRRRSR